MIDNIPVHVQSRRRRRSELQMVVLEANKDNNPKCDSNKQHYQQLVGVKKHLRAHCGVAVSVKKEVQAAAAASEHRYLNVVNNVEPSKFFQPIVLNPTNGGVPQQSLNEMNSKEATATYIILAAQLNDAETIQRLAIAGVDLNLTDRLGYSALTWSIILNHRDAARALISCGANIEVVRLLYPNYYFPHSFASLIINLNFLLLLHLKGPYTSWSS